MFNDRLQIALKNKNITGNALCKKLGIPNTSYSNWKDNRLPRAETLKQIAEILEVSTDWLLEREGAPDPEVTKLVRDFSDCDDVGKSTIISCAEFQAKRCRSEIAGVSVPEDEDNVLKPFA